MLKLKYFTFFLFIILTIAACQTKDGLEAEYRAQDNIHLVPRVQNMEVSSGYFTINSETIILVLNDSTKAADYLKGAIEGSSDFDISIKKVRPEELEGYQNYILIDNVRKSIDGEWYGLSVDSSSIYISGMNNRSVMHGVQTLKQLFIDDFFAEEKRNQWYLPCIKISDSPKFRHRGLLLDCSRHFFEKAVIKKYIDLLSFYKMNVLHWHLTEDQGWRVEIESYPKLTQHGAWRTEASGEEYGGFYSKADIRDIVTYASEREITIIPEIEMPGHAQAAISSYPNLSCTGKQYPVANDWGVFKEIYCAGNDSVFLFLESVLDEVMELFPSPYIHIGGDEAPKFRWEHCKKCQSRMRENGLENEHELQRYFISRIEKYLNSKGRKLIGWDEILEGGLSENATIQSWRGMDGGILAAKAKHNAIMSPTSHAYFDYDLKAIDLKKVYEFNPIPDSLDMVSHQYIIGGECNMWTEHVPNDSVLDSKVFPRLLAMSEVLWSNPEEKDYDGFYNRVQNHYKILSALDVRYGAETVPIDLGVEIKSNTVYIDAQPGHKSLTIKYKWIDDSSKFIAYQKKVQLKQSGTITFQAYKHEKTYGMPIHQKFEYHKALGEEVRYKSLYNRWYKSSGYLALVDGRLGSADFRDGCWQGFWGDDVVVNVDLDSSRTIGYLETHFYQYNNSWIFMPREVIFEGSLDGESFYELGRVSTKTDPKTRGKHIESFHISINQINVKHIRLTAKNIGKVPAWHEAAGSDAWLFIDEIVVK